MSNRLDANTLTVVAQGAGFSRSEALTMAGIALAESGGVRDAVSPVNSNGTRDYGLWQINSSHRGELIYTAVFDKWADPDTNAGMARTIYKAQGFKAWTTYRNGAYKNLVPKTIPVAEPVANVLNGQTPTGNSVDIGGSLTNGMNALTSQLSKVAGNVTITLLILVLLVIGILLIRGKTIMQATGTVTSAVGGPVTKVVGAVAANSGTGGAHRA